MLIIALIAVKHWIGVNKMDKDQIIFDILLELVSNNQNYSKSLQNKLQLLNDIMRMDSEIKKSKENKW